MRILGLQSGISLDGIDVVIVDFYPSVITAVDLLSALRYEVIAFQTFPWSRVEQKWLLRLREGEHNLHAYALANYSLGDYFSKAALTLMSDHSINTNTIDLVSSHGQTICGRPHLELGELSVIAQRLGITTVGDFRPADVSMGGSGGPCTCTYDALLLRSQRAGTRWRTCLNIGGTCSVTFCPPQCDKSASPYGFDIGLGSLYIDWAAQLYDEKVSFDAGGQIARQGKINPTLLKSMLAYSYLKDTVKPISVSPEDFNRACFDQWYQISQTLHCTLPDFLATLTELVALTIAKRCHRFGPKDQEIIVRGGIKQNTYFMDRLFKHCNHFMHVKKLFTLADIGYDENAWETVMYAMMGYLCVQGLYNFFPACTGAKSPVVGGKICPGKNFKDLFKKIIVRFDHAND